MLYARLKNVTLVTLVQMSPMVPFSALLLRSIYVRFMSRVMLVNGMVPVKPRPGREIDVSAVNAARLGSVP